MNRYLNACLKRMLDQLRNNQNSERVVESLGILNGGQRESESREVTTVTSDKSLSLLSELKELFFPNRANVLTSLQTPEKKSIDLGQLFVKKGLFKIFYYHDIRGVMFNL